jgi:hypothetical protein
MENRLHKLAEQFGSDKASHGYCEFYEAEFRPRWLDVKKVLEIGIFNGASHRMWLSFFPNAKVYGLENGQYGQEDKWPDSKRFVAYGGDQGKLSDLWLVGEEAGPFDLIVDDGGHTMWQQQLSFAALWPYVKPGGWYVIEDLHTSLIDSFSLLSPAGTERIDTGRQTAPETTLEMLERLAELGLDVEIHQPGEMNITSIIRKGEAENDN